MFFTRFSASKVYLIMGSLNSLSHALIFTVLSVYYVTKVGLNPLQLVLVGTLLEAVIFLCEVPTGVVADTFSRRRSVIIGVFLTGLAFGMQGLLAEYWLILLAQVVWGVGATFISGAGAAWIADEVGEEQLTVLFLRNAQYSRVAGLVGTVASVGLASINLTIPILLSGGLFIALALFLLLAMPERNFKPIPREERNSWQSMGATFGEGVKTVRSRPLLLSIVAIGFFIGAASEGFDRLWEAHFLLSFRFPELGQFEPIVWFGIINVGAQLLGLLTVTLFSKRVEAQTTSPQATARLLLVLQSVTLVSLIAFGLAGNFWLALAVFWFREAIGALLYPVYDAWLAQNIPSQVRATVLSMNSQINAVGQIADGPGVGAIGNLLSVRAALVTTALLLSPSLALYARLVGRPATTETTHQDISYVKHPEV